MSKNSQVANIFSAQIPCFAIIQWNWAHCRALNTTSQIRKDTRSAPQVLHHRASRSSPRYTCAHLHYREAIFRQAADKVTDTTMIRSYPPSTRLGTSYFQWCINNLHLEVRMYVPNGGKTLPSQPSARCTCSVGSNKHTTTRDLGYSISSFFSSTTISWRDFKAHFITSPMTPSNTARRFERTWYPTTYTNTTTNMQVQYPREIHEICRHTETVENWTSPFGRLSQECLLSQKATIVKRRSAWRASSSWSANHHTGEIYLAVCAG